jgi:hypothetical protein
VFYRSDAGIVLAHRGKAVEAARLGRWCWQRGVGGVGGERPQALRGFWSSMRWPGALAGFAVHANAGKPVGGSSPRRRVASRCRDVMRRAQTSPPPNPQNETSRNAENSAPSETRAANSRSFVYRCSVSFAGGLLQRICSRQQTNSTHLPPEIVPIPRPPGFSRPRSADPTCPTTAGQR